MVRVISLPSSECPIPPNSAATAKVLQLCLTLYNPTDGSPPGFPVPGVLQARVLEWVAIAFSTELSLEKVNPKIMITLLLC